MENSTEVSELLATCNRLFDRPDGGVLIRRVAVRGGGPVGSRAGCANRDRARVVSIDGDNYLEHRIVFLMIHGWLPEFLDHINRDRKDNRPENLRPATTTKNNRNVAFKSNNSTGYKGVVFDQGKFKAMIRVNGKRIYLGVYASASDAAQVYDRAVRKYHRGFGMTNRILDAKNNSCV